MQPETWNASWYIAARSLRYTPTTTCSSTPGQGYSHAPYSYGGQAYGYGGNYSGVDDQRMHIFPLASGPSPFVIGSTPTPPPQKKKEAHTTAVMSLPAEKEEWDLIPESTDKWDPDVLQTAAKEKKQWRMLSLIPFLKSSRAQPALRNPMKQRKYEDEDEADSDSEGVASVDSDSDDEEDWRERERRKWGKAPPPVAEVVPPGAAEFQHSVCTTPHPFHPLHIPFHDRPPVIPCSLIKFKRKGALMAGINLEDAQSTRTKLFDDDAYTLQDLHADQRGRMIHLRWAGFSHLTYEILLDVHDGHVSIEALARSVARACSHYLASNMAPVMYSEVELDYLEEIKYGVWQPKLTTR
ncbi:hypothetical protein C8R45DRAFT_1033225 [Mycena sanguinolenta]|nr:hypothetical protein C8R45DRAFT_1033225 [Mycena sanguinolenta]